MCVKILVENPESKLYDLASERALQSLQNSSEKRNRNPKVHVKFYLSPEQRAILQNVRPELDFVFTQEYVMHNHALAAVSRLADCEWFSYFFSTDAKVLEVGGKPQRVIGRGVKNWHVSVDVSTFKGCVRSHESRQWIDAVSRRESSLSARGREVLADFVKHPDKMYIHSAPQDITEKFDVILLPQSGFDMTMSDFAKMMHGTGARHAYGSIIGTKDCLNEQSGNLPIVGGFFYRKDEDICFGFNGDATFHYVHKYENYKNLFHTQKISYRYKDDLGRACVDKFLYSVEYTHAGSTYFTITRLPNDVIYDDLPDHDYINTHRNGWLRIRGYWIDTMRRGSDRKVALEYHAPEEIFDRLRLQVLMNPKIQMSELISYARSQNIRFAINGIEVKADKKIPPEYFEHAVSVAWCTAQQDMIDTRSDLKAAMGAIKTSRTEDFSYLSIGRRNPIWFTATSRLTEFTTAVATFLGKELSGYIDIPEVLRDFDIQRMQKPLKADSEFVTEGDVDLCTEDGLEFPDDPHERVVILEEMLLLADSEEEREGVQQALDEARRQLQVETTDDNIGTGIDADNYMEETTSGEDSDEASEESNDSGDEDVQSEVTSVEDSDDGSNGDCKSEGPAHGREDPSDVFFDIPEPRPPTSSEVIYDRDAVVSMSEFIDINNTLANEILGEARWMRNATMSGAGPNANACQTFDCPNGRLLKKLSVEQYGHQYFYVHNQHLTKRYDKKGYDFDEVQFVYDHNTHTKAKIHYAEKDGDKVYTVRVPDGWYYTYMRFKIENSRELADAVVKQRDKARNYPSLVRLPKTIIMNEGVPGCGKTHALVERIKKYVDARDFSFFVLIKGKKAREETLQRAIQACRSFIDFSEVLSERIRTLDSFTMSSKFLLTVKNLHIDEAMMAHSGQLYNALIRTCPARVEMSGDSRQVPYVNYAEALVNMKHGRFSRFTDITYNMNSYRLSYAGGGASQLHYDGLLRCVGRKNNGVPYSGEYNVVHAPTIDTIPKPKESSPDKLLILCYSQFDKELLLSKGFCKRHSKGEDHECQVRTAAEAQGSDTLDVILVRTESRSTMGIYAEPDRVIVALTRCCRNLTYYTANTKDLTTLLIRYSSTLEARDRAAGKYDVVNPDGTVSYNKLKPYVKQTYSEVACKLGMLDYDGPSR